MSICSSTSYRPSVFSFNFSCHNYIQCHCPVIAPCRYYSCYCYYYYQPLPPGVSSPSGIVLRHLPVWIIPALPAGSPMAQVFLETPLLPAIQTARCRPDDFASALFLPISAPPLMDVLRGCASQQRRSHSRRLRPSSPWWPSLSTSIPLLHTIVSETSSWFFLVLNAAFPVLVATPHSRLAAATTFANFSAFSCSGSAFVRRHSSCA